MLDRIREVYPDSQIICGTLVRGYVKDHKDRIFPDAPVSYHIDDYNNVIRDSCKKRNIRFQCADGDSSDKSRHSDRPRHLDGRSPRRDRGRFGTKPCRMPFPCGRQDRRQPNAETARPNAPSWLWCPLPHSIDHKPTLRQVGLWSTGHSQKRSTGVTIADWHLWYNSIHTTVGHWLVQSLMVQYSHCVFGVIGFYDKIRLSQRNHIAKTWQVERRPWVICQRQ